MKSQALELCPLCDVRTLLLEGQTDMNPGTLYTCVLDAVDNTSGREWDSLQGVERQENAKDDFGPIKDGPGTKDHRHCNHQGH